MQREQARRAYDRLLSYAKPGIGSGNYKRDLAEMLEKKEASIMAMSAVTVDNLSPDVFADIRKTGAKDLAGTGCVIMSKDAYEKIMDELADYEIEREAARRIAAGDDEVFTEEEVLKELGITEEDMASVGDVEIE